MVEIFTEHRDGEHHVAEGHDYEAPDDCGFIVLGLVGDNATHEAEHIYARIEDRVDDCGILAIEAELGAEKQHQHRIHDVVAEALAHVAQRGRDESFWLVFKHNCVFKVNFLLRYEFFLKNSSLMG